MPKFKFKFLLFFLFFFSNFSQVFSNPFKFAARLVRRIEKSDGFFQDHEILSLTGKLKKVSELKVGDFVKTYNVKNKVFEDKQITKIEKKFKHLFFKVSATLKGVDESGKPKTLKIDFFKKQKLYLFNQEGWIFAKDLKPGNRVFCLNQASGFVEVESVGLFDCDNKDLYRISVKDNKNIFLSEFGILTHNFSIAYPIITVGSSLLKFVGVEVAQIIATTALVSAFLSHMQQERERFEKDEEQKKKLKNPSEQAQSSLEFSQPISKTGSVGIILGPSTIGFKASTTATISSSLALGAGVGIFTSLLIKSYVDSLKKEALEKEKTLRDKAFEKELLETKIEEEAKADAEYLENFSNVLRKNIKNHLKIFAEEQLKGREPSGPKDPKNDDLYLLKTLAILKKAKDQDLWMKFKLALNYGFEKCLKIWKSIGTNDENLKKLPFFSKKELRVIFKSMVKRYGDDFSRTQEKSKINRIFDKIYVSRDLTAHKGGMCKLFKRAKDSFKRIATLSPTLDVIGK